ncbi:MAG: hypothetical protein ABI175_16970 [Polyangiales bacterium]
MSSSTPRYGRACIHAAALAAFALLGCAYPVDDFSTDPDEEASIFAAEPDARVFDRVSEAGPDPAVTPDAARDADASDGARRDTRGDDDDDDGKGKGKGKGK